MTTTIQVCRKCYSPNCDVTAWVNVNRPQIANDGEGPLEEVYCNSCQAGDAELMEVDTAEAYILCDADGNEINSFDRFVKIADALEVAANVVLNVWPDPEVLQVCIGDPDAEELAVVARVERVERAGRRAVVRVSPTELFGALDLRRG